ncbi:hypothetical protein NW752_000078 [Fusarium irregulare]|nr:hypothetical protein NW752_000078 [Fusarium irregulare]
MSLLPHMDQLSLSDKPGFSFAVPAEQPNFTFAVPSACKMEQQESHPHLQLLGDNSHTAEATGSIPIFRPRLLAPAQSGLLGCDISRTPIDREELLKSRLFYNVADPTSTFICGSQGSGKSHTLSSILENCLIPCKANYLPRPLAGLVFHYDTFISDTGGMPCEAAYLSSDPAVSVRVLCAPSNIGNIKRIYAGLPNVTVQPLRTDQRDLNTSRMLDLMAANSIKGGSLPLYLHVIQRILRDMRIAQQKTNSGFDYKTFKRLVDAEDLKEGQVVPLQQRLDTLESFMDPAQTSATGKIPKVKAGIEWKLKAGQLTIVDLSCPCVTAEAACSLFNICLSIFLEQDSKDSKIGRIVALDEAHKYMNDSSDSQTLTESLLSVIRLQRHLGTRVVLSTQEPTISPKLLDLCSTVIVHRFTSPAWFIVLRKHLAGVSRDDGDAKAYCENLFSQIVELKTGEALLFCPSALVTTGITGHGKLGNGAMKIRVRQRVTEDGGKSIMAD